jgi:hypothetical protein
MNLFSLPPMLRWYMLCVLIRALIGFVWGFSFSMTPELLYLLSPLRVLVPVCLSVCSWCDLWHFFALSVFFYQEEGRAPVYLELLITAEIIL